MLKVNNRKTRTRCEICSKLAIYIPERRHAIIDYMIFFNSFTCNENFSLVCSKRDGISSRLTMMTFLHIFVILFLFCCHLTCEMKSHHGLTSWNFSLGWKYPRYHPHFHKRLPLTCLTGFCLWLCCVRDDNLSENFPTQPYMSLFFVFSGGSKFCLLQLFLFSMQLT